MPRGGARTRRPARPATMPEFTLPPEYDIQTEFAVARVDADPDRPTGRVLFVDGIECSYVDLADPTHLEFSYVQRMADILNLTWAPPTPVQALHLGGGACSLARYVQATRPRARQVVYERDPRLIQLAREHLGLRTSPNLRVRIGDGRERITERPAGSAHVVFGDAFEGVLVPPQLATREFADEVRRVLRPDGVYVLNVIDCPPLRVSKTCAATLLDAFEHVALVVNRDLLRERDAGNTVFAASALPLPVAELARVASRGPLPDVVLDRRGVTEFAGDAKPLTDGEAARWRSIAPPDDLAVPIHGERTEGHSA